MLSKTTNTKPNDHVAQLGKCDVLEVITQVDVPTYRAGEYLFVSQGSSLDPHDHVAVEFTNGRQLLGEVVHTDRGLTVLHRFDNARTTVRVTSRDTKSVRKIKAVIRA